MDSNKTKELLLSPKSTKTSKGYRKLSNINNEFKEKYNLKEDEVYDFNTNSYIKCPSTQCLNSNIGSNSRVQELINKYNKPILRRDPPLMNPINVMYAPRNVPSKCRNPFEGSQSEHTFKGEGRNLYFKEEDKKLSRSTSFNKELYPKEYVSPFYNTRNISNTSERSRVDQLRVSDQQLKFNDIHSRRTASPKYSTERFTPSPKYSTERFTPSPINKPSPSTALYGPSVELSLPLSFTILNTVYSFSKEVETSLYYIEVSSNITWTIKKDLKTILDLLKEPVLRTRGLDKQVRDNMISTLLNKVEINNNLQYFIMTDITREKTYKGEYLLLNKIPYIFKLVGKALVSYNNLNRVHRIFILEECQVEEGRNEYSFYIRNREEQVELYASCKVERDEWVRDIKNFINKR